LIGIFDDTRLFVQIVWGNWIAPRMIGGLKMYLFIAVIVGLIIIYHPIPQILLDYG